MKWIGTLIGLIGLWGLIFYTAYTYVLVDVTEQAWLYSFLATRFPWDFSWLLNGGLVLVLTLGGFIVYLIGRYKEKHTTGGPT